MGAVETCVGGMEDAGGTLVDKSKGYIKLSDSLCSRFPPHMVLVGPTVGAVAAAGCALVDKGRGYIKFSDTLGVWLLWGPLWAQRRLLGAPWWIKARDT